jgi:hypothetical protein
MDGLKTVFKRKGLKTGLVAFKLKQSLKLPGRKYVMSVAGKVSGPDALVASLLYSVVKLDVGSAQDTLQAQGYDFTLAEDTSGDPCRSMLPEALCTLFARQLAHGICLLGELRSRNGMPFCRASRQSATRRVMSCLDPGSRRLG